MNRQWLSNSTSFLDGMEGMIAEIFHSAIDKVDYDKDGNRYVELSFPGIAKDDITIVIQAKIDMLQSGIDMALLEEKGRAKNFLERVQRVLSQIATSVSSPPKVYKIEPVVKEDLKALEKFIDSLGQPPQ